MNSVTQSAATSATRLFGALTTTADVVTTGVSSVGNLFAELNQRSSLRLRTVTYQLAHDELTVFANIREQAAMNMARSIKETEAELAKDPEFRIAYDAAKAFFASALDKKAA